MSEDYIRESKFLVSKPAKYQCFWHWAWNCLSAPVILGGEKTMFVDHLCLFKCFFQQLMKYVCFLQVVTLQEAKLLLKEDDDLIIAVYDYWLNKRLRLVS